MKENRFLSLFSVSELCEGIMAQNFVSSKEQKKKNSFSS